MSASVPGHEVSGPASAGFEGVELHGLTSEAAEQFLGPIVSSSSSQPRSDGLGFSGLTLELRSLLQLKFRTRSPLEGSTKSGPREPVFAPRAE